ncbi:MULTISPECIES: hypothetical protein [unclassified Mesorhizobium]|nr:MULTISPECIES: hypothetical protein [unclassified Mesorhizobium]
MNHIARPVRETIAKKHCVVTIPGFVEPRRARMNENKASIL